MQPEDPFPHSHSPATCPYSEPEQSSPCLPIHFLKIHLNIILPSKPSGPGSSIGIGTNYGLDGPGSSPGGDEIFRLSRPALGPTQPHVQWVSDLFRR